MGKGDRRTLRGKLFTGTFGNKRPRKKDKKVAGKTA
jgi:ribosomal small subunit protein bTHX